MKMQFNSLSPETQAAIENAYKEGFISEKDLNDIKEKGIDASDWDTLGITPFIPTELVGEKPSEEPQQEAPIEIEDEEQKFWNSLKRGLSLYDEKVLRIEVRKRNPTDNRLIYIKGGIIRWQVDAMDYSQILELIVTRFGSGQYYFTFKPDKKDSKIKPFSKEEILEISEPDIATAVPQPSYPGMQPIQTIQTASDNEKTMQMIKDITQSNMNLIVNMMKDFQSQIKEQQTETKNNLKEIMAMQNSKIDSLGNAIINQKPEKPVNAELNALMMVEKFATIMKAFMPSTTSSKDPAEIAREAVKQYQEAFEHGREIGQAESYEEEEGEEPEKEEEKPKEEPKIEIPEDASIAQTLDAAIKGLGKDAINGIIRGVVEAFKQTGTATGTPQPKPKTEGIRVPSGISASKEDIAFLSMALDQIHGLLQKESDEFIIRWAKGNIPPIYIPQLKALPENTVKLAIQNLRPDMMQYIDRILAIIKQL